ncbi:hypothetical protein K413DRAFT_4683 [Clostridium sp. ASBs410]|nr:hypothetical protein K413DRAFT_4683 [Clostridium sp. ASBs410]
MKKQILVLGAVLIMGVTGCGSQKASETETSKETVQQSSSVEETTSEVTTAEEYVKRENTNFRNAYWGDDIETVKKYEEEKLEGNGTEKGLLYSTKVGNYSANAMYFFDNDGKLYQGMYGINEEFTNAGQYIPLFQSLRDSLKEKYGEPDEDTILRLANQSQIDFAGDAKALEYGYVVYRATWNNYNGTEIMIGMQAQNYKVQIVIGYTDVNYKEDVNNSGL